MSFEPPPFQEPGPIPASPAPAASERDLRFWATLCHLSALLGLLIPSVGAVVGPLVVWLLRRHDHPTLDAEGRESLNFQLSILIYTWVLAGIGLLTTFILVGFFFLLAAPVIGVLGLIFAVIGAVKVNNGERFRYPFCIRFV